MAGVAVSKRQIIEVPVEEVEGYAAGTAVGGNEQRLYFAAEGEELIVIDLTVDLLQILLSIDNGLGMLETPVEILIVGVAVGFHPFFQSGPGLGNVQLRLVGDNNVIAAGPVNL